MKELYQIIKRRENNYNLFLATVTKGEFAKEKVLLGDSKLIWKSSNCDFLNSLTQEMSNHTITELFTYCDNEVFIEKIGAIKTLVICGAGHVALSVVKLAKMIGFYVIVIDDREEFTISAKKAGADKVICDSFENALNNIKSSNDTYYVVVTRGHDFDKQCVEMALNKPNAYIGMMGSKSKVTTIKKKLVSEGYDKEKIDEIKAPIGLDIGAEGPEEIAIAIISQIIEIKNINKSVSFYSEEILNSLISKEDNQRQVLATIIHKTGSTPRKVGTKILINSDGTFVGTIGGGKAESFVIEESLKLMSQENEKYKTLKINMCSNGEDGQDMICGGNIKVFLEVI